MISFGNMWVEENVFHCIHNIICSGAQQPRFPSPASPQWDCHLPHTSSKPFPPLPSHPAQKILSKMSLSCESVMFVVSAGSTAIHARFAAHCKPDAVQDVRSNTKANNCLLGGISMDISFLCIGHTDTYIYIYIYIFFCL